MFSSVGVNNFALPENSDFNSSPMVVWLSFTQSLTILISQVRVWISPLLVGLYSYNDYIINLLLAYDVLYIPPLTMFQVDQMR